MRIAIFLLMAGILEVSTLNVYSQKTRLTLNFTDTPLPTVLDKIESESDYYFLYNEKLIDLKRKVTLNVNDQLIEAVLDILFTGTDIKYNIIGRKIILAPDYLSKEINPAENLQQKQITGKVIDENGNPLPGVNIQIEGTTTGTITDINGKYSITVTSDIAFMNFSFMGYDPKKIQVTGKSVIDISMVPTIASLQEVLVVGYGTSRKADLTGSVTAIKQDEYKDQPVNRVDQILQGRTAGVNVVNSSGAPGGISYIRIRGPNSINGNNDPLYVIDGFVGADFKNINPADISSIQILKDASSTAIYGSRGANGVVLITTKSGVSGKSKFSITSQFVTSQVLKKWDLLDAGTFAETVNLRADAKGTEHPFTDAQVADFKKNGGTDWQNEILRTGNGQEIQAEYSGGNNKVTYFASGNYYDQKGILINSYFKRYSFRTNLDARISDKLKATLKSNFARRINNNTSGNYNVYGPFGEAIAWAPTTPAFDETGQPTARDPVGSIKTNPIEYATNDNITESNSFSSYGEFNYQIINGLTLNIGIGLDYSNTQGKGYYRDSESDNPGASRSTLEGIFLQNTNALTYIKSISDIHKLTLTAVAEYQINQNNYYFINANSIQFPDLKYKNLSLVQSLSSGTSEAKETIGSYIGRASYSLIDRYLLTASVRHDRSSKFRGNNQTSVFPSIGIGWILSEENFIRTLGVFDNLKLRASWGQTGSQAIPVYGTVTSYNTSAQGGEHLSIWVYSQRVWSSGIPEIPTLNGRLPHKQI